MSITLSALQKQRTDTAANWTSANPTLLAGELGFESDTGKVKLGTGSTAWTSLGYLGVIPSSGTYPLSQLIMPLGTAGAPPLTFVGDLNTGIYSPGADQVAISSSGQGRLYIDATGRVGINTSSPTTVGTRVLHISGAAGESSALRLSGNAGTGIDFIQASNGDGYIYQRDNSPLIFGTNATERLRITASGAVGVGTTSPGSNLHVKGGSSGTNVKVDGSASGDYTFFEAINPSGVTAHLAANGATAVQLRAVSNHPLAFFTNNAERARIDSTGRLGIGNSVPTSLLHCTNNTNAITALNVENTSTGTAARSDVIATASSADIRLIAASSGYTGVSSWANAGVISTSSGATAGMILNSQAGGIAFQYGTSPIAKFDSSGRLGIGTTTVNSLLEVRGTTDGQNVLHLSNSAGSTDGGAENQIRVTCNGNTHWGNLDIQAFQTIFTQNGGEKARIDSSGRLLVGTSTGYGFTTAVFAGNGAGDGPTGPGTIALSRGIAAPSLSSGSALGHINFTDNAGEKFASINGFTDGTAGSGDYPGRLVFSTTADGASSPTEQMRIGNQGTVFFGTTAEVPSTANVVGATFYRREGLLSITRDNGEALSVNRKTSDGNLVVFHQDGTVEGTITVSGTTVSYNGAHLSRWSQLPSGVERTEILRGSVLSNIDEMCEWDEEDNEQLNRMKVSDVEGDKNVSGVFQAWDDDDDTYTDDFYCAMTGDFIIRIAEGVTVERGDLLMSAGDGTAKPQDDDIIRSKTIAKVTSTNVSCTYEDGSYCVPCVLMAC
jgi:hypothetical protein